MDKAALLHKLAPSLLNLVLVAIGGAVGSCLRYLVGVYIEKRNLLDGLHLLLPLQTLLVNLFGAFLIGIAFALSSHGRLSAHLSVLITVGFLGGLTTFSSLALECVELLRNSYFGWFSLYLILTVLGGLLMAWLGFKVVALFI